MNEWVINESCMGKNFNSSMFIVEMLTKLKTGNSIKNAQQRDDSGK